MGLDLITLALATKATDALLTSQSKIIVDTELEPFNPDEPAPTQFQTSEALVEGESYTIKIASGVYTSVCKKIVQDGMVVFYVGSPKLIGGEDTGESFFFATIDAESAILALCADFNGGTTMTVSQETKTIDPKYLPAGSGGGLPVITIATIGTNSGTPLTAEETAQLENALATSDCAVIYYVAGAFPMPILCVKTQMEEAVVFRGVYSAAGLTLHIVLAVTEGTGIIILGS